MQTDEPEFLCQELCLHGLPGNLCHNFYFRVRSDLPGTLFLDGIEVSGSVHTEQHFKSTGLSDQSQQPAATLLAARVSMLSCTPSITVKVCKDSCILQVPLRCCLMTPPQPQQINTTTSTAITTITTATIAAATTTLNVTTTVTPL